MEATTIKMRLALNSGGLRWRAACCWFTNWHSVPYSRCTGLVVCTAWIVDSFVGGLQSAVIWRTALPVSPCSECWRDVNPALSYHSLRCLVLTVKISSQRPQPTRPTSWKPGLPTSFQLVRLVGCGLNLSSGTLNLLYLLSVFSVTHLGA